MNTVEPKSLHLDTHEFHFVPPDLIRFTFRGSLSDEVTKQYLDFIYDRATEINGSLYVIYDLSAWTRIDERARKRVTKVDRPYPFAGMAIIGTSFTIQALANMIIRAVKLIRPDYWSFPHKFFANVADAEAWIAEIREKRETT